MALTLEEKLKDPKYKELADSLKGLSPEKQAQKVMDMTKASWEGGYLKASAVANKLGHSEDEIYKNPSLLTNDNTLKEAIRATGGDKSKLSKIISEEVSKRSGGSIKGRELSFTRYASREEISPALQAEKLASEAAAKTVAGSSSQIAYDKFVKSANTIDSAADKMLAAANGLLEAAGKKPIDTPQAPSLGGGSQKPVGNDGLFGMFGSSSRIIQRFR
jgi:hypothetical protein